MFDLVELFHQPEKVGDNSHEHTFNQIYRNPKFACKIPSCPGWLPIRLFRGNGNAYYRRTYVYFIFIAYRRKKRNKTRHLRLQELEVTEERSTRIFVSPIIHPSGLWAPRHRWRRSLGLDKDFDDAEFALVKRVVQFGHVFERNPMGDHEPRVELSGDNVIVENLTPVQMNGS